MRKSLWILLGALFVAFGAPCAHADGMQPCGSCQDFTYTYTVTGNPALYGATITTIGMPAITGLTILTPADLSSYSLTGSYYSGNLVEFILDYDNDGAQAIVTSDGTGFSTYIGDDKFPLPDYSSLVVASNLNDTLTVTLTPEPGTFGLLLLGIGSTFVMRKLMASRLGQAT